MYIQKSSTFLDFLTIKLDKIKIDSSFFSCVENSPYLDTTDIFGFKSKIEFDFDYSTHRIYFILDGANNKVCQIMIVNDQLNKRSDYYDKIVFYGTFFNFFWFNYKDLFINIFGYFGINGDSKITRFDVKNDVNFVPYFKNEYINSPNTKKHGNTYFCYSNKTKNTSATYEFRIYDKKLDIIENLYGMKNDYGDYIYRDIYQKNKVLYRIEVQYNSKKIKEKGIKLKNILDDDFLFNEFSNYCFQFLKNTGITKKIYFKDGDKKNNIALKKEKEIIKHTSHMCRVYIEKLHLYDYQSLIKIVLSTPGLGNDILLKDTLAQKKKIYMLEQQIALLRQKNIELQKIFDK